MPAMYTFLRPRRSDRCPKSGIVKNDTIAAVLTAQVRNGRPSLVAVSPNVNTNVVNR